MDKSLYSGCYVSSDGVLGGGSLGRLPQGIYACNSDGTRTYLKSGEDEWSGVTFNSSYTIYWFEVLEDGTITAVQNTGPNVLVLGQNTPILLTGVESTANVIMYLADTISIDQSSGTAINVIPTLTASISGGAWSSDSSDAKTRISFTTILEGENTVYANQTDPNGIVTQSTPITIKYADTMPLLEIDNQPVSGDISTELYEVDVKYLYGGRLLDDGQGNLLVDENGFYIHDDVGTIVTVTGYALLPASNIVQITNITDDFGNTSDTDTKIATKIPAITNNGATTIDEETYGTSYAATDILTIDAGAPYETTATPNESPYTFVSGDYRIYNFTASYTYPATTVSNSEAYDITYKEFAVTPYSNKVWDEYSTQEFRLDGTEVSGLTETNTHPTGTYGLTYRAVPSFTDNTDPLYTGTPAGHFDVVPTDISGFTVPLNNSPYMSNYGNLLTPQQTWGIGGWAFTNSASSSPFCKGGSIGSQITRLFVSSTGDVRAQIGGSLGGVLVNIDQTKPHFYYIQHYFNGSAWAIDVLVDGVLVAENVTADIGTNTNDLAPLLMGVWAVASQVDPSTDAQNHPLGGWVSNVHATNLKLTERQIKGLFYRNKEYYLHGINGDSMSVHNFGGNASWAVQYKSINDQYNYKTSVINIAVAGRTATQMGVEVPTDGYEVKPSWYPAGTLGPVSTQSAEYLRDEFDPDMVMYLPSHLNDGANDYYNKNSGAVQPPTSPAEIGVNGYADMAIYEAMKLRNFWTNENVQMWHSTPTPQYDTVNLKTQDPGVVHQDAQGITRDQIVGYFNSGYIENLVKIFEQVANTGTYVPNPTYYDNPLTDVHWNQKAINEVAEPSFRTATEPTTIASRDRDFDPVVIPVSLQDGQTVYIPTFDFTWSHDGVEITEEITLIEGSNNISRQYTNTANRTGSFSIDVTYEAFVVPSVAHLPMDSVVQDGADYKFLDSSGNGYDALVFGNRTVTNGQWQTSQTNGDYCYIPTSVGQDWFKPVTSEFSASITCTLSALTNNRLFGIHPVSNSFANGGSLVSSQWRYKHGGLTTAFGILPSVDTLYHVGMVCRFLNPGYEVDLYIDGIFQATITMTGTNYDALSPAIISGSFLNDSDHTAGADENVDGALCNFRYYTQAVSSTDWPKIAVIDTCI